jgi:hypothetical protein
MHSFIFKFILAQYIRDFALFSVCSSCTNCPSARRASVGNAVCRDTDVLRITFTRK